VKAKQFVLTFRDYLIASDRSVLATPEAFSALSLDIQEPSSPFASSVPQDQIHMTIPDESESDAWVLEHINVTHVQPIIEAIDQDGSGFISVQEANKFALSRPKGMKCVVVLTSAINSSDIFLKDFFTGLLTGQQVKSP
jgi:hypothetical protein